jgi:hypothetical protein
MLRQQVEARAAGSSAPFLTLSCFRLPSVVRPFVSADDGPVARSERAEDRPTPATPPPAIQTGTQYADWLVRLGHQPSAAVADGAASSFGTILMPGERRSHAVEPPQFCSAPSTAPSTQTSHLSWTSPVRDEFLGWLPTTSPNPVGHASSNSLAHSNGLAGTAYLPTATASGQPVDGFNSTIPTATASAANLSAAPYLEENRVPLYSGSYGTEPLPFLFFLDSTSLEYSLPSELQQFPQSFPHAGSPSAPFSNMESDSLATYLTRVPERHRPRSPPPVDTGVVHNGVQSDNSSSSSAMTRYRNPCRRYLTSGSKPEGSSLRSSDLQSLSPNSNFILVGEAGPRHDKHHHESPAPAQFIDASEVQNETSSSRKNTRTRRSRYILNIENNSNFLRDE